MNPYIRSGRAVYGTPRARWMWRFALLLLLAGYLRWLIPALAPYATGADSSGYLWSARLFHQRQLSVPIDAPRGFPTDIVGPDAFAPLGARVTPGTWNLVPTYPTGWPFHIAAANLFLPEESAVKAAQIAVATATLFLLYFLARDAGLAAPWALAASVMLAFSPLFLYMAVQPMSDTAATMWAEATMLCAWRGRSRPGFVLATGACLGMATLVRPTNALLIVPALAAMPWTVPSASWLAAGGIPFAAFLAIYQTRTYGNPLASGYGDMSTAFTTSVVAATIVHYARWLPRLAGWMIVCAPIALVGWRGALVRWRMVMGLWLLVFFGTYAFYPVTSETWWSLRFVLPAFPPLIIASLVGLRTLTDAIRSRTRACALAAVVPPIAIAISLFGIVHEEQFDAHRGWEEGERVYPAALQVLAIERPAYGATLALQMSGAANYYVPEMRVIRYDALSPPGWNAIRAWQTREGVSVGALLYGPETDQLVDGGAMRFPCRWESRGRYRHITFWECPP